MSLNIPGNIARQTLTVPGTSFVQSYRYDSLCRLSEASEKTGSATNWSQTWSYDRYGNRIGFAQDIAGNTNAPNPSVDPNTNRFNAGQGFGYDANGNVVSDVDPLSSLPRQFVFNGDNKQSEVKRDGVTIGRYFYDGEGKRVKKETDTEATVFVYSAGKLVAEYSTQLSQSPSVAYTTTDHLGTPRVITDQFAQVKARRDFMPFGEELYTGVGGRTGDTGLKYSSNQDDIRQKFTGYQKDNETGLDFAEARMYENRLGRFTAVDPLLASGKSADPQTFNRYAYVINNPLALVDPDGEKPVYMYRTNKDGGRHWVQLDSTWKTYKQHYDDHKKRGYEVEMGYGRIIERPDGKFYQLTEEGFRPAVPIPSGEAKFDPGNNPTVGFDIIGSAFDNVVPFGQQLRHKLGLDFANENSETYNRFGTAATIVQLPFILKNLPKFGTHALASGDDTFKVASSLGEARPMLFERYIEKGERVADIINEGKALTFSTGNEFAVVRLASGRRALVSGGSGGIEFAPGQVTRIFGHSHPTSAPPSFFDADALRRLNNSRQFVFHGGLGTSVRRNGTLSPFEVPR